MSMIPKDARTSSSMKRTGTIDQPMNDPSAKRFKTFTSTQGDISDQQSSSIVQPSSSSASSLYSKLDPNDPEQAKRMEQRRKTITKGKNTAGYDAYIQQIPKHKRRPRSMETPSTPDPTLDIPNKRWQGLVKAWRVALHKFDPPDLVTTITNPVANTDSTFEGRTPTTNTAIATPPTTIRRDSGADLQLVDLEETSPISCAAESVSSNTPVGRSLNYDLGELDEESDDDDDLL